MLLHKSVRSKSLDPALVMNRLCEMLAEAAALCYPGDGSQACLDSAIHTLLSINSRPHTEYPDSKSNFMCRHQICTQEELWIG